MGLRTSSVEVESRQLVVFNSAEGVPQWDVVWHLTTGYVKFLCANRSRIEPDKQPRVRKFQFISKFTQNDLPEFEAIASITVWPSISLPLIFNCACDLRR